MWVPLRVRSQYSVLESTLSIDSYVETAKSFGMESIALTDYGNMYGAVDFFKACKGAKIHPILGCEIELCADSRFYKKKSNTSLSYSIILLVKDRQGYKNLCKLSSLGFLEGFYYVPRIDRELLEKYSEGLICLAGGFHSSLSAYIRMGREEELRKEISWFKALFKEDFYFELSRHQMSEENIDADRIKKESWLYQKVRDFEEGEKKVFLELCSLSKEYGVECVAANDIRYLKREDWKAHEILINIPTGEACEVLEYDSRGLPVAKISNPKRRALASHEFYFKSPQEMEVLFADMPQLLENSLKVAGKCQFSFDFKTLHYPVYYPPGISKETSKSERQKAVQEYLYDLCQKALEKRYPQAVLEKISKSCNTSNPLELIKNRLDYEFQIIAAKEMADYLLIVYDFISWARGRGIAVGPGRGSAAGSIICYLIGITDIEPLSLNLFFERFINPERVSYPDIDVDICMERRSEVIDYTVNKYGRENVAQIITFGSMKAKMAIRDVGRMLSVPLAKVNSIAKLVPEDLNITLEKALEDPELKAVYETDLETKMLIDMARKLEGSIRNTGIHAAGIIISPDKLMERIPICVSKDSDMLVTQYSMKPVETVGMLKIDFLGLKTLTSIQKSVNMIRSDRGLDIDVSNLPLDDEPTFDLLNQGKTLGIFQLESGGMQDLIRNLHIDSFEEIIAVGALYRPGPMDMIPSFINRKHKREEIEIDHPLMGEILKETYGVMVYQEQVMQIASKLAGYSLGEGDVLRRAMGKKDHAEMKRQKAKFIAGALNNGVEEKSAIAIFDKIEKFASYGFNKSHAAAYAYLSYTTAFLKANFPKEWMASLLTCDKDDLTKVAKFVRECSNLKIPILPPCVNESREEFVATQEGIRFSLAGIKGMGDGVVHAIISERSEKGPFKNFFDFINRIDTAKVGKKNIELLIEAGAFDFTAKKRSGLLADLETMYDEAHVRQKEKAKGVLNLFSFEEEAKAMETAVKNFPELSKQELLKKEKELLGFYLTAHPLEDFQEILKKFGCSSLKDLRENNEESVHKLAFIVEDVQYKLSSKTQKKFAIVTIGDGYERMEMPVWPELYEKSSSLLIENNLLLGLVQVDKSTQDLKLNCRQLAELKAIDDNLLKEWEKSIKEIKQRGGRKQFSASDKKESVKAKLFLKLNADLFTLSKILQLKKIVRENPGPSLLELQFFSGSCKVGGLILDSRWRVNAKRFLEECRFLQGVITYQEE